VIIAPAVEVLWTGSGSLRLLTAGTSMRAFGKRAGLAVLALAFVLPSAGCNVSPVEPPAAPTVQADGAGAVRVTYDHLDLDAGWNDASATHIMLEGGTARVDGPGAAVSRNVVEITSEGTYVVSGTLTDGQLRVDAPDTDTVQLVLNGADVACFASAPVYVLNAGKTVLTLAEGTANRVSDVVAAAGEDAASTEPNAVIFSHDDLTINGGGSLAVTGRYYNGIQCQDNRKIAGGSITVDAVNDGIRGRDSIAVRDGSVTVKAGGDGMQSGNDVDAGKGFVLIEGGTLSVDAALDGIQAQTRIVVTGGTLAVTSGSGHTFRPDEDNYDDWDDETSAGVPGPSTRGLKAGTEVLLAGGLISIDSFDDAVSSGGRVGISGGDVSLASADDGIRAVESVDISGGDLRIAACYEGIESALVSLDGGAVHVTARDDGINIRGVLTYDEETDHDAAGRRLLEIRGGYIAIECGGDGVDVNGRMVMTGGVAILSTSARGDNAVDYMRSCTVDGGVLIAAGGLQRAQAPGKDSAQPSIKVDFPASLPRETLFHLRTRDGEELLTYAPPRNYQSMVFSSPGLTAGTEYVVYTGGTSTGGAVDGLYSGGEYTPGTEFAAFRISAVVTTVRQS